MTTVLAVSPFPSDKHQTSVSAFKAVLNKLEDVLREENTILESRTLANHEPFIIKKNQILREIMILQKLDPNGDVVSTMVDHLRAVRRLVDINRNHLHLQVQAMSEITEMLTEVALAEDADGTYSRS
jgi:hypothetical protein